MRAALLFLACAGVFAQSPLDVSAGLDGQLDRYVTRIAKQQWEARAAAVAAIRTPAEVQARQAYIRKHLMEEIGGFPEKTPLNARITGTLDRGDYKVEKLIFESQPHYYVTANVFVPATGKGPYPAVLGTAGHSLDGKAADLYERVWVSLAKRGFVVLAYDPPGQGERLEYFDPAAGKSRLSGGGTGEHTMAGMQCLLTGTNVARYFIWDGIRAFDYLLTRPDVDPKRIGVSGNSGGGTQSSYLAAYEPRLAAAAPSCYLTSWEKLWSGPGPQDAEQDFVNFLKDGLDFPDFLIAFAPKPIQMATATKDFFPIDGAKATFAEAHRVFETLGAGDHMGFFEFDDTHGWSQPRREATYRWFTRWLQGKKDDGAEPEIKLDTPHDLQCTETGQVATSFRDAETVQSLNAALAARLYAGRSGAGGKNIAALVRARLNVASERTVPHFEPRGEIERKGYKIEKIEIQSEPGITVPALVFVPSGGPQRKPAVIYVDAAGKAAAAGDGGAIEGIMREGKIVLALDPRGWGESAARGKADGGYTPSYQSAMRVLLVGKTIPGMQTVDVLRSFDYLRSRADVNAARISITGKGNGGVLALYAAVLEPRVTKVTCAGSPESYMGIVRQKMHEDVMDIVVPGVLRDFDLPDLVKALGPRCVIQ
jgi:cephalosporin-C deacetylase-like acetyl esterase